MPTLVNNSRLNRLRPLDLKISVMFWVIAGAIACAAVATAFAVIDNDRQTSRDIEAKSEMIRDNLRLQRLRIENGMDTQRRFPDWEFLANHVLEEGLCIQFSDTENRVVRSNCVGARVPRTGTPEWFSAIYRALFAPGRPHHQAVETHGLQLGTIEFMLDPAVATARAWRDARRIVSITGATMLLLCLLVYLAIDRALKPTSDVVAGLNRLANGELSYRLPAFRLIELQRISEVVNHMAGQLETTISERQDLARRLVVAQEDERRHLARELHDEFGQSLAAINAIAASIETTAETRCTELLPEARTLSEIVTKMMGELRGTLVRLRPAVVEEIGLVESLRALVASWNGRLGRTTSFAISARGQFDELPDATAVNLYRIAQEGLTNAAKHAEARHVKLTLERLEHSPISPDSVALTIEDDGKGYDVRDNPPGLGLFGVKERIAMFGGMLNVSSSAQSGTRLSVTLPVAAVREAA